MEKLDCSKCTNIRCKIDCPNRRPITHNNSYPKELVIDDRILGNGVDVRG